MTEAQDALAALEGVVATYQDQTGKWRTAPPETLAAILRALGHSADPDGGFETALAS